MRQSRVDKTPQACDETPIGRRGRRSLVQAWCVRVGSDWPQKGGRAALLFALPAGLRSGRRAGVEPTTAHHPHHRHCHDRADHGVAKHARRAAAPDRVGCHGAAGAAAPRGVRSRRGRGRVLAAALSGSLGRSGLSRDDSVDLVGLHLGACRLPACSGADQRSGPTTDEERDFEVVDARLNRHGLRPDGRRRRPRASRA
jgi:hypothetical protein